MGNPMPKHKRVESAVGTDAGSERAHRYQVMGNWKQKGLIRVVEPTRVYPTTNRHKRLVIEVGPEINFTVPSTDDYPSEWLVAQIMLAINSTSTPWKWTEGVGGYPGKWRPKGQSIKLDSSYNVTNDQLMHRAMGENGKYVTWYEEARAIPENALHRVGDMADQMRKEIDEELIHALLYGKSPLTTNTTLPPPVKRKP